MNLTDPEKFPETHRWDEIMAMTCIKELRSIKPDYYENYDLVGIIPQKVLEHVFGICNALWIHSGDPSAPHAELTSGKCSNGFINTLEVLSYTNLNALFAQELCKRIIFGYLLRYAPDWVIGSDHAGATFSYRVAEYFGSRHDFTEKNMELNVVGDDKAKLLFAQGFKRFKIEPHETVLQVEELVTTFKTLGDVRTGLRFAHPDYVDLDFLPFVATLIHRSPDEKFEGVPIVYLAHFDIEVWNPEQCPLCANGSKRIKPKANWNELVGR